MLKFKVTDMVQANGQTTLEITKDLKTEFNKLLEIDLNQIKGRTKEQHAAACRALEKSMATGSRGVLDTQFSAHFTASDANKDKLLDLEEYLVFVEKEKASRAIRREPEIERTRE